MAKPVGITTGRVVGQYIIGVADGPDEDDEPDFIPAAGTIDFTTTVGYIPFPTMESGTPLTLLTTKITGILDSEGFLCAQDPADPTKPGRRGIRLISTDNVFASVKSFTWTATPRFVSSNGTRLEVNIPAFSFALPAMGPSDEPLDLSALMKIPASPGLGTEQAEALVAAATTAVFSARDVAVEAKDFASIAVDVHRRAEAGEFKGETGDKGEKGDKGDKGDTGDTGLTPNFTIGEVVTTANPADGDWVAGLIRGSTSVTSALAATFPSTMKGDKGDTGGWGSGSQIPDGTNLNSWLTPGHYTHGIAASTLELNYPVAGIAGILNVSHINKQATLVRQEWLPFPHTQSTERWGRGTYTRQLNSTTWSPWRFTPTQTIASDAVGFRTVSTYDPVLNTELATSGPGGWTVAPGLGVNNLDAVTTPGVYRQTGGPDATLARNYPEASRVGTLTVEARIPAGQEYGPSVTQTYTPFYGVPGNEGRVFHKRILTGGAWQPWRTFTSERVDNSAGRTIYTWDPVSSREQLIFGDTGLRDISSLMTGVTMSAANGAPTMRRVGSTVTINLNGISPTENATTGYLEFLILPQGFRYVFQNLNIYCSVQSIPTVVKSMQVVSRDKVRLYQLPSVNDQMRETIIFDTNDPWPTTLPGVPLG